MISDKAPLLQQIRMKSCLTSKLNEAIKADKEFKTWTEDDSDESDDDGAAEDEAPGGSSH